MVVMADALRLSSSRGRGAVFASVVASGMAFLDNTVVNVALPHIGGELHASVAGLQWTISAYTLALAALVLFGGALGDRYGRRKIFLFGVVWFTLASVLCGLSVNVGMLTAARAFQGCGAALLTPGSLALLQASFASEDRARAIGAWSGLSGVSTAIGPFLGGWLIDTLSWRWIFFINVPLAVLAIVAAMIWVPESSNPGTGRFDVPGAVLAAAGLAGITYALIQGGTWAAPAAVLGVLALVVFVLVEHRRGDAAMLPPRLFSSRQFTAINLVTFFIYAGVSGISFFLIVELQVAAGYSALQAGVSMLPMTLLLMVGSSRAGALGARIGPRWPLAVGSVTAGAGILLMLRIGRHTNYLTDVLPAAILFGLGMTLVVAPLTAAILAAAPSEQAGTASGVNNAVARSGGLLAVAALPLAVGITGREYQQPAALDHGFHLAVLGCAALYAAGALITLVLVKRAPDSGGARPAPNPPEASVSGGRNGGLSRG
ncbi:MFS transporter [Rugosimonospora africana]|uniref:MFS transporter n=1 Tax=Rugosimonospora africana TaxID=556532 RepID=A0A8J3QW64_9ACTN|nr:MFS transporter [Rugosimonospora africana]GIH18229.1 MFS transporter [Rugosimonospora africana]